MNWGDIGARIQESLKNKNAETPATQSSAAQCIAAQVFLNGKEADMRQAKEAADQACPDKKREADIELANKELLAFRMQKSDLYQQAWDQYSKNKNLANQIVKITDPTMAYLAKLDEETATMGEKSLRYNQNERAKRRSFLDEDPQGGVTGLPGLRTYDDKVMLAFWITYGISIICILLIYIKIQGGNTTFVAQLTMVSMGTLVAYGFAYYAIVTFA